MNNIELLDVVDSNDNIIEQLDRSEIYARKLGFRVINAFLVNDSKQVWIPRRLANKKLFPSCLDASVGGHVMAGESYENAFIRELAEELNIQAHTVQYRFVAKLSPAHGVSAHMQVYIIDTNQTPLYNTNDFSESHWFTIDELLILIQNGEPAKGDLPKLIQVLRDFIDNTVASISL